jgi:indolepyruvate ferredoxin oxidoreductase beta subunit
VSDARLLSVLIPAVGGQGGGVLLEWIVDAALAGGLQVHGTSIPGVAQRTGSTTYYVELFTEHGGDAEAPTFSLYPVPGALDVLLAPEFLEIGRMIELGFPSPDRTTIIASTHRLYSIHEKITTGHGIYPMEKLHAAARAFSRTLYAFDTLALAREHGTEANSVLLGALAGSGILPIRGDAYRDAIRAKGVQVDANLRGFEAGLAVATRLRETTEAGAGSSARNDTRSEPVPASATSPAPRAPDPDIEQRMAPFPEQLRPTLAQAIARLVDYQDRRYAVRYLERLTPFARDPELARVVARHLAVWMTYEDAIRVATASPASKPRRFASTCTPLARIASR